jgi:acyl-coenzyme A synthetase/AMP-(fatty) acid ligase
MVSQLQTHLTAIEGAYNKHPQVAAFKIPKLHPTTGKVDEWTSVSYAQFRADILAHASYWSIFLQSRNIKPGSVVTLWLRGLDYNDATLIFGISRAGYTLQLISLSIPTVEAVFDVAQRAESKIIIYDSSQKDLINAVSNPIPTHCRDLKAHQELLHNSSPSDEGLPVLDELAADPNAVVFILHTSGSTSGVPKLVPWTYQWLDHNITKLIVGDEYTSNKQSVNTWMGTFCHGGQLLSSARAFFAASTFVQPSSLAFDSDELIDMVRRCSLTVLAQFPPLFAIHLQRARRDPELRKILQSLSAVVLVGMAPTDADMAWCAEKKIPLQLAFASTEAGVLLMTIPGKPATWYYPVEASSYQFEPVEDEDPAPPAASNEGSAEQPRTQKLLELVVLSDSKGCPVPSLRSHKDGHFHTGDLFEEVAPGFYESRGRGDDWIKLLNAGRCDTRAIEGNALELCRDLIHSCVATGYYRPSVVLFVEPRADNKLNEAELQNEILRRITPGQVRMWAHEKIVDPRQILVAPMGSLPRTSIKGNIRRKAVEEMFKERLDRVYEEMSSKQ